FFVISARITSAQSSRARSSAVPRTLQGTAESAVAGSPLFNGTVCTRDLTECCARLVTESYYACMEYDSFGFTPQSCIPWQELIRSGCATTCADCDVLGRDLYQQCAFQLQVLGNGPLIKAYCNATYMDWVGNRCPRACHDNETLCETQE
ncbi:unnamed protein product, partial [Polarella glacialis]